MKALTRTIVLLTLAFTITFSLNAQQMFMIHEDHVNPDKMMQYEATAKMFHGYVTEHGGEMQYATAMTNDLHYMYITPIENFAAIDNMGQMWATLNEKVGKEKMDAMWAQFDACYDVHKNYIVHLNEEFSYYPSGDIMSDDGGNYRKWTFIYGHPDKMSSLKEIAKKWRDLYEKHEIDRGFRVYSGGLGTEIGTMIIVDYGKDLADIANHEKSVQEKLGMEGQQLWLESVNAIRKVDEKYGMMRPDLSVSPKSE